MNPEAKSGFGSSQEKYNNAPYLTEGAGACYSFHSAEDGAIRWDGACRRVASEIWKNHLQFTRDGLMEPGEVRRGL